MITFIKKTVPLITVDFACVLTQQFETDDSNDAEIQIGYDHRCTYDNNPMGRELLLNTEPEDIIAEVLVVWGDHPTVKNPQIIEDDPSKSRDIWDEIAEAIMEGVNEV